MEYIRLIISNIVEHSKIINSMALVKKSILIMTSKENIFKGEE